MKRTLAINPAFGEIYRAAGELAARNYRFDEAVGLAREAVALDPTNARAHADLGMHLMRTGDEAQARQALDRAFSIDPYDVVTYNLLALLDTLDKFVEIREGDIILKLDPDEAPVMREYAMPLAQKALKTLSAKYQFTPKGPILVEIFPKHDDFAVRTLGLPGMIGALGACFGRVVTLDSPRVTGRPPGSFSWQATLWHEMAHVITLQMSNQRVPRWLTEGISEYEEAQARPEWGTRDGSAVRARAGARQDAEARGSELRLHAPRHDRAGLLPGLAARRSHRPDARRRRSCRRSSARTGRGSKGTPRSRRRSGCRCEQLQASFDKALDARFGALRTALRAVPGTLEACCSWSGEGRAGAPGSRGAARGRGGAARQLRRPARVRPGAGRGGRSRGVRAAREGGGARAVGDGRRQPARDHGAAGRAARRHARAR